MVADRPDGLRIARVRRRKAHNMSMKHRRGNRETKKPKQNKTKVVTSVSPFAPPPTSHKTATGAKRK
jgi:hypothetical protein